jgi:hypothetical protein
MARVIVSRSVLVQILRPVTAPQMGDALRLAPVGFEQDAQRQAEHGPHVGGQMPVQIEHHHDSVGKGQSGVDAGHARIGGMGHGVDPVQDGQPFGLLRASPVSAAP